MKGLACSSLLFAAAFSGTACGLPPGCLPGYRPPVHTARHELLLGENRAELTARTFSHFASGGRGAWGHRVYGLEVELAVGERPSFVVETATLSENLSRSELLELLRRFQLQLAADGSHVRVRSSSGRTRLFHFLHAGPGFDLGVATPFDSRLDELEPTPLLVRAVPREQLCDAERSYELWRAIAFSRDGDLSDRLWNVCNGPAVEAYVADCKLNLGRYGVCQEAEKLMLGLSMGRAELRRDIFDVVTATCDEYSCHLVATTLPFAAGEEREQLQKACPSCVDH